MAYTAQMQSSLEQIELEMLERAREVWGIEKDLPFEAFDPLVKLLIGACAVEVRKISNEIHSSRNRVIERLAQIMMPDLLQGSVPASAIIQIQPVESAIKIGPELQVAGVINEQEIVFSPTGKYDIIDGKVERNLVLLSDNLINITNRTQPQIIDIQNRQDLEVSHKKTLFIGLDLNDSLQNLNKITFFFDWVNIPLKLREEYCKLLQFTRWNIEGKEVKTNVGFVETPIFDGREVQTNIYQEFDISKISENRVNDYYKYHFITVFLSEGEKFIPLTQKIYPDTIRHLISHQDSANIKPLVWFEIQFPVSFPNAALSDQLTHCLINCIPAMNRKLETRRHYSYDPNMNVISLKSDGQFLAVQDVVDSEGTIYPNIQTLQNETAEKGSYYLRRGGIGRIDLRRSKELIVQLQDLLKDESSAFSALYPDDLVSDLLTLKRIVAKIDKNISQLEFHLESPWYVIINRNRLSDSNFYDLTVRFWTTAGTLANKIPPGEINRAYYLDSGPSIKNVVNVTPTIGGKDGIKETDLVSAYRKEILTRGRIVTYEDIKALCFEFLGNHIKGVDIKKGIMVDGAPMNGIVRSINIILKPSPTCRYTAEEWLQLIHELKKNIERQWTGIFPLCVQLDQSQAN